MKLLLYIVVEWNPYSLSVFRCFLPPSVLVPAFGCHSSDLHVNSEVAIVLSLKISLIDSMSAVGHTTRLKTFLNYSKFYLFQIRKPNSLGSLA